MIDYLTYKYVFLPQSSPSEKKYIFLFQVFGEHFLKNSHNVAIFLTAQIFKKRLYKCNISLFYLTRVKALNFN